MLAEDASQRNLLAPVSRLLLEFVLLVSSYRHTCGIARAEVICTLVVRLVFSHNLRAIDHEPRHFIQVFVLLVYHSSMLVDILVKDAIRLVIRTMRKTMDSTTLGSEIGFVSIDDCNPANGLMLLEQ